MWSSGGSLVFEKMHKQRKTSNLFQLSRAGSICLPCPSHLLMFFGGQKAHSPLCAWELLVTSYWSLPRSFCLVLSTLQCWGCHLVCLYSTQPQYGHQYQSVRNRVIGIWHSAMHLFQKCKPYPSYIFVCTEKGQFYYLKTLYPSFPMPIQMPKVAYRG